MSDVVERLSRSAEQTVALGAALGAALSGGERLALCGALGAGKTHFVRGLARGLAVPADEPVQSPTFVLLREYAGRLTLLHADYYRLRAEAELDGLGIDEWLSDPGFVLAAEWADRFPARRADFALWIEFEHGDLPEQRRLRFCATSVGGRRLLAAVRAGDEAGSESA